MRSILPGLAASLLVTVAATVVVWGSAVSPVTVAILLGLVVATITGPRAGLKPGTGFAVRRLLRAGIVLVGIRLSLLDVVQLGAVGIPFVAVIIASAILLARWLAPRLGVSENLGLLTAAATSICGVTAALATAPAIRADEREVAYAVTNTTLFGMLAMLVYPFVARTIFGGQSIGAGLFLGTSIHDTSQVVGAALAYRQMFGDELAFKAATVTKLTRNLFIVGVVPLLAWISARGRREAEATSPARTAPASSFFPLFIAGFVGMAIVRTIGDLTLAHGGAAFGVIDPTGWSRLTALLGSTISGWLLTIAMAGVGLSTDLSAFRALGARPLWLGAIVALAVGALGLILALLVAPFVHL